MNLIPKICELLGVEVGEEFKVTEKELREYEKGADFFDILADPKLLCLYDDGE